MSDSDFSTIGEIIDTALLGGADFSRITKTVTLFSFWKDIVGKKFECSSKPYAYKYKKLFVTCENAFVVQELSMYKEQLIKKTALYTKGIDMEITDIIFNYKNWLEHQSEG